MASTRQNAALILIGILAILLSACGGPSPEKITRDFLDALIAGDRATLSSFVEDGLEMANSLTDHETEDNEVFYAILEKISYDIKSSEIDGDTAVVHTVITAPDLPNILTKVMAEALPLAFAAAFAGNDDFTEEVLDQMFLNALTSEDTPMVTTEAAINLIKRDGKWLIAADNDELGNAVTGGAVDYFDKLFGPAEKENEDVEEEEAA